MLCQNYSKNPAADGSNVWKLPSNKQAISLPEIRKQWECSGTQVDTSKSLLQNADVLVQQECKIQQFVKQINEKLKEELEPDLYKIITDIRHKLWRQDQNCSEHDARYC